MEDERILALYVQRSEQAIAETAAKFGNYCYSIAYRILCNRQDSEETVSDTYMRAWNAIPPTRPDNLAAWLGRVTRHGALDRWWASRSQKRGGGELPLALEELGECVGQQKDPQSELEQKELEELLNRFVRGLPEEERKVFVCRYWYLESIADIGARFGFSQSKVKSMLLRTRNKLRQKLEKEGYGL